jgi:fatty-acyl-CoA synthase
MSTPSATARIAEMLQQSAQRWPDHTALVDGDTTLTYGQMWQHVCAAAAGFAQLGVRPGDHIAFYLAESWRHVVALYGALHLGAVAVPLNLSWEAVELEYALQATDVDVLVVGRSHRERELWARLDAIGLNETGACTTPRYPRLRQIVPDWDDGGPCLQRVLGASPRAEAPNPTTDLAYLMFTSGSMARPKAAAIRHDAALRVAQAVARRLDLGPQDRVLNISPFYHCAGLVAVLLASHCSGAAVSIFEGYQHERMLEHMVRDGSTVLIGFDVVTMRLIRAAHDEHGSVPVKKMLSGPGRPIFDEVTSLGIDLAIMYGLTEASNVVTLTQAEDDPVARRDSNGLPLVGVDLRICDPDTGEEVAGGELGEIAFRGWNLMSGYYLNGSVSLALDADGFFHTGDYGFQDESGRLYYRGRYAAMIKTGGENVSELEVESFLATEFPWLNTISVIGLPDEKWGEIVVAAVSCADDRVAEIEGLRERCRGRIAGYKIPKAFVSLEASDWPVTAAGKVRKRELAELVAGRLERPHARS